MRGGKKLFHEVYLQLVTRTKVPAIIQRRGSLLTKHLDQITQLSQLHNVRSNASMHRDFSRNFHQMLIKGYDESYSSLLSQKRAKRESFSSFCRNFWFGRKQENSGKKKTPKLILIQNPFTWLMIKVDFSVLKHLWDPSFKESEFKFGTKQAISRITHVIRDGQFQELNGLLTKAARLSLERDLDRNWSEKQRSLLALDHDDIQISTPRKVYFIRIADKKYCDVDMAFLALKWAPINSIDTLIFTEIFARFHREYTPHCIPEWTIAFFKVTRFQVLRKQQNIQQ